MREFYLGVHRPYWLNDSDVPLFVSRVQLLHPYPDGSERRLPRARTRWALDSGGFSELDRFGGWQTSEREYAAFVTRARDEIGLLDWAAPQDWMCEPRMLKRTGLDVAEHQTRTVANFLRLRMIDDSLPIVPVLQGFELDDYLRCVELYDERGVDLTQHELVGLGTICRRQDTSSAHVIVRRLAQDGLRLHGFGIKTTGIADYGDALYSADSMAWSYFARRGNVLPEHVHEGCRPNNCRGFALAWRDRVLAKQPLRLWEDAPCATA